MTIYILQIMLITIIYLFLSYKGMTDKKEKIFLFATFIILCVIACFRGSSVGYDTEQYITAYHKAANLTLSTLSTLRYEYGFTLLCVFLNKITASPQILLIITSLFINYAVLKFIYKKSDNKLFSVLLYILLNIFFFYTSAMRQAIAIAIILLGFDNLEKKKYFKFAIYIIIASLFHESAFLTLIFIFFKEKKYNKLFLYELIIASIFFFAFGKNIFDLLIKISPRLNDYSSSQFMEENYFGALIQFLLNLVLFVLGYIIMLHNNRSVLTDKNNKNNIFIGLMSASVIFYLLTMRVSIFNRFSPYFSIFIIIWLPNCIAMIKNPKNKLMLYVGTTFILFIYWGAINILRPEWYGMIPYSFF